MKTSVKIIISEPCNQSWAAMEKRNGQNFCEACNKCVIDFSGYSNTEIMATLNNSSTEICGRLSETQLNQLNYHLVVAPKNRNWMKYFGVLAMGASVFTQSAHAAIIQHKVEISNQLNKAKGDDKNTPLPKIVYGYLLDENKKPLSGIKVTIENTKLFAFTDQKGCYEIKLTPKFNFKNTSLVVKSMLYDSTFILNYANAKQADFRMKRAEEMIMGRMIMVKDGKKTL